MRFLLLLLCAASALAAEVESFSPQGAVAQVRQVKARFTAPMVKFGDPRLADPFDVNCGDLTGKGRWVDERNWVYDFDADVPAARSCTFSLTHGLHALDGSALVPEQYVFTTGGPEIGEFWPQGGEVGEDQTFLATFTAAPDPASVAAKTRCEVSGIAERIPVVVLPKDQRDILLAGLYGKDKHRWPSFSFALRCQRPLPAGANGAMVFDAGLAAPNGAATREPMRQEFHVRDKFTATISCEHTNSKAGCVPILPISLNLSEPIRMDAARGITLVSADGKQRWAGEPVQSELLDETDASGKRISTQLVTAVRFKPPFAEHTTLRVTLPAGLKDAYGRPLANANQFPLNVAVDSFPPLAKFAANFGIVEREVGVLPVTVRNVGELMKADKAQQGTVSKLIDMAKSAVGQDQKAAPAYTLPYRQITLTADADIIAWYQKLLKSGAWDNNALLKAEPRAQLLRLPTAADDREAEVIGMPLAKSGLTVVEVESARLGGRLYEPAAPMFVRSGGLTTNLSVHFRRGVDDALVWVTTLDKGWLVNAATVSIYDCKGKQLATGKTDNKGVWQYPKALPRERYDCPNFVFARLADDVSFVSSEWREGIEPWRFGVSTETERRDRNIYHAILDRGLYRAGETVSMKLVARETTAAGFGSSTDAQLGTQLRLRHLGSDESVVMPLVWKGGVAEASWKVPTDAKLGQYEIAIERKHGKDMNQVGDAGSFAVAEFRVPLMRGMLKLPVDPVAASKVDAVAQVQYLAGGPAAGAPVRLRALLTPGGRREVDGFDSYTFSNGDVAPIVREGGTTDGEDEGMDESGDEGRTLAPQDAVLDKSGGTTLSLSGWPAASMPTTLQAEVEYSDPNGEVRTTSASTILWPAALQVGYHFESPRKNGGKLPLQMAVVNLAGKPLAGRAVKAEAWVRETYSHRRRLVGGFYSYRNETRYVPMGQVCAGKTDAHGIFACQVESKRKGNILIRVSAQDDAGHTSMANGEIWVPGEGEEAWWESGDGDRVDLFPDKKHYDPGETA
ncbi:MAG: hypothetical protein JO218_08585, partial [Burkholderiales bacterium]|nr:hypothetical protein [Burkholderiales bacterium]